MNMPVRVTTTIMGATVFNTKQAVLEVTPDGRIRVTQTEPGQPPVVVLDTPPQGLAKVSNYTVGQSMLTLKPTQGKAVKLSMVGSMLAPEPNESADSYARRQASTGMPPQSWWAEMLAAQGVKVNNFGWGKYFGIAGITFVAIIVLIVVIAALTGAFS